MPAHMPGLLHNFALMLLRRDFIPNPMKKALEKGFVFRSPPTDKHIKKYDLTVSEFDGSKIFNFGDAENGLPILYFCHGGGYVAGMFKSYYEALGPLYKALGFPIIAPDYPMPPDVDARAVRSFALSHYKSVRDQYPDSKIIVAGDSAGANMALAMAQGLAAENGDAAPAMIDALYLLYSWLDLSREEQDYPDNKEEVLLAADLTPLASQRFRGDIAADDPLISPLFGRLDNLPPIRMISADKDMLFAETLALEERLKSENIPFEHINYKGYGHDFWLLPTPDGRKAMKAMAKMMQADIS